MRKIILSILSIAFCSCIIIAQNTDQKVISTAGDYNEGADASISWTLGEIVTETLSGSNGTISQGFQQSFDITPVIDKIKNMKIDLSVYPNPTSDFIKISIQNSDQISLSVQLTDISGKQLLSKRVNTKITNLDLSGYAQGTYLLQIKNKTDNKRNTYTIIKN